MLGLAVVIMAGLVAAWQLKSLPAATPARTVSPQLAALLEAADELYTARRWTRAEQAYLKVLKLDHRNLSAYSRLGVIYAAQKNHSGAIECFEIAIRLRPSAVTYQNLGLALHENRNYVKAALAFEKAIAFEPSANRYVGLAKARKGLHDQAGVAGALEQAAALDPSGRILTLLEQAYLDLGQADAAANVRDRLVALALPVDDAGQGNSADAPVRSPAQSPAPPKRA